MSKQELKEINLWVERNCPNIKPELEALQELTALQQRTSACSHCQAAIGRQNSKGHRPIVTDGRPCIVYRHRN